MTNNYDYMFALPRDFCVLGNPHRHSRGIVRVFCGNALDCFISGYLLPVLRDEVWIDFNFRVSGLELGAENVALNGSYETREMKRNILCGIEFIPF